MLPAIKRNISALTIPQNHIDSAAEVNQLALNHYALAISAKICSADEKINLAEKRAFLGLFPYFGQQHLSLLSESADDDSSVYISCKRFTKFANNDVNISARLYAKLFKLATSDATLNIIEISYLEKIVGMLGLSKVLLEKALEYYFLIDVVEIKKFVAYIDAKNYYRKEIFKLHPDHFIGDNILSLRIKNKVIELATERVKILNENYRKSLL